MRRCASDDGDAYGLAIVIHAAAVAAPRLLAAVVAVVCRVFTLTVEAVAIELAEPIILESAGIGAVLGLVGLRFECLTLMFSLTLALALELSLVLGRTRRGGRRVVRVVVEVVVAATAAASHTAAHAAAHATHPAAAARDPRGDSQLEVRDRLAAPLAHGRPVTLAHVGEPVVHLPPTPPRRHPIADDSENAGARGRSGGGYEDERK